MKCVECGGQFELREGTFKPDGRLLGSIPKHNFYCRECTTKDLPPGQPKMDGPPAIPQTDW